MSTCNTHESRTTKKKKDMQCTYNAILLSVRITTVAMEKQQWVVFVAVIYTLMSLTIMWGTIRSLCSAHLSQIWLFSINFHECSPRKISRQSAQLDRRSLQTLCSTTRSRLPIAQLYMHHNVDTPGCYWTQHTHNITDTQNLFWVSLWFLDDH